jgi:hypothetical protein
MSIEDFVQYSKVLHGLTADFVRVIPDDKWDFTGSRERNPLPT